MKASRDSDKAVREAYFNAADRANSVGSSGSDKAKRGKVHLVAGASHWGIVLDRLPSAGCLQENP